MRLAGFELGEASTTLRWSERDLARLFTGTETDKPADASDRRHPGALPHRGRCADAQHDRGGNRPADDRTTRPARHHQRPAQLCHHRRRGPVAQGAAGAPGPVQAGRCTADETAARASANRHHERPGTHRRSRAARRPAERKGHHRHRRQDRADRPPVADRPAQHRGDQLRQPEVGAATGRCRRGVRRHHPQAGHLAIRCWFRTKKATSAHARSARRKSRCSPRPRKRST